MASGSGSSSFYSQDSIVQNKPTLGYTPFEYWKGPKPVAYPFQARQHRQHRPTGHPVPRTIGATTGGISLKEINPIQPTHLHAAQEFVASLSQDKNDIAGDLKSGRSSVMSEKSVNNLPSDIHPAYRKGIGLSRKISAPPAYGDVPRLHLDQSTMAYNYNKKTDPWWNVKAWGKRTWAIVAAVIVIIFIVVVVVAVMVTRNNEYPNYTKLSYKLADTYSGEDFFDNFDYFEGYDPTAGFVHYVPKETATNLNLTSASNSTAVLKVDTSVGNTSSPDASTGRFSVRVTSKTQYNKGLFVFDVKHTPYGCGTWPALWLTDPSNWPDNGEIDVMESYNKADLGNMMTLHTSSDCSMAHKRKMTGSSQHTNCDSDANDNAGCGVDGPTASFGSGFNDNGGGIMAMEWRNEGIRIWQFARDSVPTDISNNTPDPSTWGTALADFPDTGCDMGNHFKNQSIIVNIDLCGELAGGEYSSSGCPLNCTDYVANYPQAFMNAYWEFGSFQIYQSS